MGRPNTLMKRLLKFCPFSGKRRGVPLECVEEEEGCPGAENTPLTPFSSGPLHHRLRITNGPLVTDGGCMSTMAPPTDPDIVDHTHRETMPALFVAIQIGDNSGVRAALDADPYAARNARYSGFPPLHAACHAHNFDALSYLLQAGAKVDAVGGLGRTALHAAVAEGWHSGVEELLRHGASPNALCSPPPTVKEVRTETPLHVAVRRGDLTSTILLLQHQPDLTQKDSDLCSVLHLAAQSRSLEITRQLLKENHMKDLVNSGNKEGNSVLHIALMTHCDAACEATLVDLVKELVKAGADVNLVNTRGECPLYLAARNRLPRVVETLLGLEADPTLVTRDGQSLLHAACHQGCATSLTHIINTGLVKDLVTAQDNEGKAPFHYGVQSGSIDCCELLLTNGDHLTRQDNDGATRCSIILRHLPSATQLLKRLFDSHVRISSLPKYDSNFRITFDYSIIYLEEEGFQSSLISELSSSRLESLLKHPLLESFLFLKWRRIKPFFYCSVSLYFLFLLLHTVFIVLTFGGRSWTWQQHFDIYMVFLSLYIAMYFLVLVPDIIIMFANFKKYIRQWETFTKATALASSAFVVFFCLPYDNLGDTVATRDMNVTKGNLSEGSLTEDPSMGLISKYTVRQVAAVSAFFGWVEFMMLLGRFPSLGTYVLMFTRVARAIIKFMAAFSSLIIGFAVSFFVLFQDNASFSSLQLSLTKTLMMMIGEIDFGTFTDHLNVLGSLFLVLFLFLVCVLMTNLLIGLAVNDIPDLQRQGKIRRLSKQASYLVSYERLMVVARALCCFPRQLRILLTSRCRIPLEVNIWPNKDSSINVTKRNTHFHVPSETIQDAILLGTEDSKMEFSTIEEEEHDIVAQFKSFKMKYTRDRRQLHRRLAQLPDTATTETILKERLDNIQQIMENQLLRLSLQFKQQDRLCSRCRHHAPLLPTVQSAPQTVQYHSVDAMESMSEGIYVTCRSQSCDSGSTRQHAAHTQSLPETQQAQFRSMAQTKPTLPHSFEETE